MFEGNYCSINEQLEEECVIIIEFAQVSLSGIFVKLQVFFYRSNL